MSDLLQSRITLAELIARLDSFDDGLAIYAEKNPHWTSHAQAVAMPENDDLKTTENVRGMSYMLEVELAREAIDVWSQRRGGRQPTIQEKCEAVIFYAENDCYLPPPEESSDCPSWQKS